MQLSEDFSSLSGKSKHPPYRPNLASSDIHLFRKLKDFLGKNRDD